MKAFLSSISLASLGLVHSLSLNELSNIAKTQAEAQSADFGAMDRGIEASTMGDLDNYGCWCYFEENHGKGRGPPSDSLDAMCKGLHDGYTCIFSDMEDAGTPCVPWEVPYASAFGFGIPGGLTMETIVGNCETNNPSDMCAQASCKVEGWFINQYLAYSFAGGVVDQSKRHDNGFSINTGCPITAGVQSEKACCGDFPSRFPYKTYGGNRDCCQGSTYNTNMFMCCNDGRVRMTC